MYYRTDERASTKLSAPGAYGLILQGERKCSQDVLLGDKVKVSNKSRLREDSQIAPLGFYEGVSKSFRTESIKYTLTTINTR